MNKPRIAILSNYPSDHKSFSGGVETATAALLEGLKSYQNEYDFHIITFSKEDPKESYSKRNGFWFHSLSIAPIWVRPRLLIRIVKTYHALKRIKPDLIHAQGHMALAIAGILSKVKVVFTIHGVLQDEADKRTGWEYCSAKFDAILGKYVHRHVDAFICISRYAGRSIGKGKTIFYIPNAVRSLFKNVVINKPSHPNLLFVGVIAPLKRPKDLLLAHKNLLDSFPDLKTSVCGNIEDSAYHRSIKHMIRNDKISGARFLGNIDQERLVDLMANSTALVLPSAQENLPMVIAEAMMIGIPVVSTRVGGIPEIVMHGETGFLSEPDDVDALTYWLKVLLSDDLLRVNMGQKARERAERLYSPENVAKATVKAYAKTLAV